jgi:hypothetical protein
MTRKATEKKREADKSRMARKRLFINSGSAKSREEFHKDEAERQRDRLRKLKALEPNKYEELKEKDRLRKRKPQIDLLKSRLQNAFEKAWMSAQTNENAGLKNGFFFTVEDVFSFASIDILHLKRSIRNWSSLKDDGRYFTRDFDGTLPLSQLREFEIIIHAMFDSNCPHKLSFIKHTAKLVKTQGWHMDVGSRKNLSSTESACFQTFKDFGYSVFVGFEPKSFVSVGRADYNLNCIEDIGHVCIPLNGILVISDNLPHRGLTFNDGEIHSIPSGWAGRQAMSDLSFHIKGFMTICRDSLQGNEQEWFHEFCRNGFVQRRPPTENCCLRSI